MTVSWSSRLLTSLCIGVALEIPVKSLGKSVVAGTSARVVAVDPERSEGRSPAGNESRVAGKVAQTPHPWSSDSGV